MSARDGSGRKVPYLPKRRIEEEAALLLAEYGGDNGPRPEAKADDFLPKQQVIELFAMLDDLQNGVIDVLEVKHGLPFRMILRETVA